MTNFPAGGSYPPGPPPSGAYGAPVPAPAPVRPQAVTNAVWLMYAGAAVSVLTGVIGALTAHSLVARIFAQIESQAPPGQPRLDVPTDVLTRVFLVAMVIGGVLDALLWLWMAWKNHRGRSWARVLSTVFFGLMSLSVLSSLARSSYPGLGFMILNVVLWVVGLAVIVLLWRPEASQYYEAVKAHDAIGRGLPWPPAGGYGGYGGYGAGYGGYGYGSPQSAYGYAPPTPPAAPPAQPEQRYQQGQPGQPDQPPPPEEPS